MTGNGRSGPQLEVQLDENGERIVVELNEPYRVNILCTFSSSEHHILFFESTTAKAQDDGKTPMDWRSLGEGEDIDVSSPDGLRPSKGAVRPKQWAEGRLKFRCPVCKQPPLEVRLDKLTPILDTLGREDVRTISLKGLAARLKSASARRRET